MAQDLRSFVAAYSEANPGEVVRIAEPVSLEHDIMAVVLEYERRRRNPILVFEKIRGYDMPVVCNVVASRRALAFALGVPESELAAEYARRIKEPMKPVVVADPSFRRHVVTGDAVDLAALPIPVYFPGDAGRYITAGMLVARDPETGVETEGYHRLQLKGRNRMGVSLHSRRRMFEYQRRAEAKGQALPCAIALGREREPEGPFGEFTGYFSRRSTEHVFVARAIARREAPWFQSIGSGRAGDHITTLGLIREAEIMNALSRAIPNVTGVHVPLSGTSSFTAYVSIRQGRPGEAKHVIPIVLGVDHYLKLVIVVDDDIDVFDESDVLWAVATRMQPDRDLVVISGSLGAMLDPSADERGVTAKLGIDATRPFGEPFGEKLVMSAQRMAWARALVDRLG